MYALLFPEIAKPPFAGRLEFRTLTQLNLRRSAAAVRAGHVCIRESRAGSYRTVPGLWVHKDDLELAQSLVEEIAQYRAARERQQVQKTEAVRKQVADRIMVRAAPICQAQPEFQALLSEWLAEVPFVSAPRYGAAVAQKAHSWLEARCPWIAQEVYQNRQGGWCLGGLVTLAGYSARYQVPLTLAQLWGALGASGAPALKGLFHKRYRREADRAQARFETVPAWARNEATTHWALANNERTLLAAYLTGAPAGEQAQCGLTFKGPQPKLSSTLPLQFAGKVSHLRVSVSGAELEEALFRQTAAQSLTEAVGLVRAEWAEIAQQTGTLLDGDPMAWIVPTEDWSELFSAEEAAAWVRQQAWESLQQTPQLAISPVRLRRQLQARLPEACAVRRTTLVAARCRASLPTTLADCYPVARQQRRKLVLVIGPTNSAKTHRALTRLQQASSGCYLGPLRLLALEVRDRLQEVGLPISLVTGELCEPVKGARHTAATVEMVDTEMPVEVAVIDEVQMLGDLERGFAWTQAIIGVPAKEVWLLGAPECESAVRRLAQLLDEPLEVQVTERLTPLRVATQPAKLSTLPAASAVIAFSRRDVLAIAAELRKQARSVSVIYGALSPEVRREQARLFQTGKTEVVVATDAIGMGMNLPIQQVYFATGTKWNGLQDCPLSAALVRQIAGRAGRYGYHEYGVAGALDRATLKIVKERLAQKSKPLPNRFWYGATWPIIRVLANQLQTDDLTVLLNFFAKQLHWIPQPDFVVADPAEQRQLAEEVRALSLPLRVKLLLTQAPVPFLKGTPVPAFKAFALAWEKGTPMRIENNGFLQAAAVKAWHEESEHRVKVLTLYCWLHYREPRIFPDFEPARQEIAQLNQGIAQHLQQSAFRCCKQCQKPMPWNHSFGICETCYHARYARRDEWHDEYFY